MLVAIIDYGSGNLRSAAKAFERAARETASASRILVTREAAEIGRADRLVLPGVGAFADCAAGLRALPGALEAMTRAVRERGRPFLGICVGMQLLATRGLEHGTHQGLDWIAGDVERIDDDGGRLKVPHMGWNELAPRRAHLLLAGIEAGAHAYFVHSFHFRAQAAADVVAVAEYGRPLAAMIARDNVAGVQFHPEKSQQAGLRLLGNFLAWRP